MKSYEKLGAFYLGRRYDTERRETTSDLLLYDSRDLTTHAVCVGMTGSGKTGLCVSLLEEAALDGVPVLAIDPKGDLGNLLLTFPELRPEDFRPWIDEDAARRESLSPADFAAAVAAKWREGLESWDQSGERIGRLRDAAEATIYTPGSDAGVPLSVLASFAAPPEAVRGDGDLMRERVATTTTGLLGLMGIDADPLTSREHILIAAVLDRQWRQGLDLDLAGLIQAIQSPPLDRIGVLDLDSFYAPKDRFELAMRLNNLLASPAFQGWLEGEPLDVQRMLYGADGKPRIAIVSIAHLPEAERMFFVALLLNEVLSWMRARPGTSSLRAILYMDEIFGYMPPTAEPPSKRPLLTLLKQARAYGLGVVLATQNPVDLDYKGLSNIGTWLLGRLQTERDKLRVLDGLAGAAGTFDREAIGRQLSGMDKRVFLMHNVHEDAPVTFRTRWAMSYLRGPMSRDQIRRLTAARRGSPAPASASTPARTETAPAQPGPAAGSAAARPVLPRSVRQLFVPPEARDVDAPLYEPHLLGLARIQFVHRKTKQLAHSETLSLLLRLPADAHADPDWADARGVDLCAEELEPEPEPDARYAPLAAGAETAKSYTSWRRALADHLYRTRTCPLLSSPSLGLVSEPSESEADFRIRLIDLGREKRDGMTDKLRKQFARRASRLEERMRRASLAVDREKQQASGQKVQTAISLGTTLLTALLGRKKLSAGTVGRATTTARGVGRIARERQDVDRAVRNLEALRLQLDELNRELEDEIDQLEDRLGPLNEELETTALRPRRSDVVVRGVTLAWVPRGGSPDVA